MLTANFWAGAAERAIKTFAQVLAAWITLGIGTEVIPGAGIHQLDWLQGLSVAAVAGAMSVLTSIGSAEFVAGIDGHEIPGVPDEETPLTPLPDAAEPEDLPLEAKYALSAFGEPDEPFVVAASDGVEPEGRLP